MIYVIDGMGALSPQELSPYEISKTLPPADHFKRLWPYPGFVPESQLGMSSACNCKRWSHQISLQAAGVARTRRKAISVGCCGALHLAICYTELGQFVYLSGNLVAPPTHRVQHEAE